MLTLTISLNGKPFKTVTCDATQKLVFGRGATCDVVLSEPTGGASSEHARVECVGGTFSVFDQGSTNGTALNGTRVRPHTGTPITNNDQIHLGKWLVECKIDAPQVTSLPAPVAAPSGAAPDHRAASLHTALRAATKRGPEAIQKALVDALNHLDPDGQRSVLNGLLQLTAGNAKLEGVVRGELARREAIRDACVQAMNSLASRHGGFDSFNSVDEVNRFFRLSDQSLELMLEWIVNTLSARKTFEEKFSAKVTRFFGLDSNPIKHALTPNQAGRYLLNPGEERDPAQIKQNLAEAFRHLSVHQLSLVAGIQSALKAAVEQLDPEKIEARASHWLGGSFKRGKAWDLFKETYQGLLDNDSKLFNEVIYPNLRHGYLAAHETQGIGEGGADEVQAPEGLDTLDPLAVPNQPAPPGVRQSAGAIPYTSAPAAASADPFATPSAPPPAPQVAAPAPQAAPPAPAGGIPYTSAPAAASADPFAAPPPAPAGGIPYTSAPAAASADPFATPSAPPPAPAGGIPYTSAPAARVDPFATPGAPPPAPAGGIPYTGGAGSPPRVDPFATPAAPPPAPAPAPAAGSPPAAPATGAPDPFANPAPLPPPSSDPFAAPGSYTPAPRVDPFASPSAAPAPTAPSTGDPFSAPSGPGSGTPFTAPAQFPSAPPPSAPPPSDDPPPAAPSSPYGGGSGPAPSPF